MTIDYERGFRDGVGVAIVALTPRIGHSLNHDDFVFLRSLSPAQWVEREPTPRGDDLCEDPKCWRHQDGAHLKAWCFRLSTAPAPPADEWCGNSECRGGCGCTQTGICACTIGKAKGKRDEPT